MRKHSKKRDIILELIRSTKLHPSARYIYDAASPIIPGLSLGTVYRNLNQFQEDGMVVSVGVVRGEERFDGNVIPHPHFICERCGGVIDLYWDELADYSIFLKNDAGHRADFRKTVFHGVCKACDTQRVVNTSN